MEMPAIRSGFHRLLVATDFPVVGAHSVPVIRPSVADIPQGRRILFPCAYGNSQPLSCLSRADMKACVHSIINSFDDG